MNTTQCQGWERCSVPGGCTCGEQSECNGRRCAICNVEIETGETCMPCLIETVKEYGCGAFVGHIDVTGKEVTQ
jgi:hypothetical protein